MNEPSSVPRGRGRPRLRDRTAVCDALLSAAETALESKTYAQVTLREVARSAGVDAAMVNYYFASKTGLFVALVDHLFATFERSLRDLEGRFGEADFDPATGLAETIRRCFYAHRATLRLLSHELAQRGSPVAAGYRESVASRAAGAVQRFVKAGMRAGGLRADADPRYLALAILTLANHPLAISKNLRQSFDLDPADLDNEAWHPFLRESIARLLAS